MEFLFAESSIDDFFAESSIDGVFICRKFYRWGCAMGGGRTHICFDVLHLFEAREEVDLLNLTATTLFCSLAILSPGKTMLP